LYHILFKKKITPIFVGPASAAYCILAIIITKILPSLWCIKPLTQSQSLVVILDYKNKYFKDYG